MDLLQNMCHISEGFNPLISTIDQDRISPNNINTKSRKERKKNINQGIISQSTIKFSGLTSKE